MTVERRSSFDKWTDENSKEHSCPVGSTYMADTEENASCMTKNKIGVAFGKRFFNTFADEFCLFTYIVVD